MDQELQQRPKDLEQLFEDHMGLVKGLVRKAHINPEDVEDVASDILVKFIEKGFLEKYDETKEFATESGMKTARFQGFLTGFVNKYVRQYLDKQATKTRKEPIRCEMPVGRAEDGAPSLWIEVYGPQHIKTPNSIEELESDLDFAAAIRTAFDHLKAIPVRGSRDLSLVFQRVVEQVLTTGQVDRRAIAKELPDGKGSIGVSDTAMCLIFKDLRAALDDIGFSGALSF